MAYWEYVTIYYHSDEITVTTGEEVYFSEEDYLLIDPQGRPHKRKSTWIPSNTGAVLIPLILNRLGQDGWEAIGNVAPGGLISSIILLKRRIIE